MAERNETRPLGSALTYTRSIPDAHSNARNLHFFWRLAPRRAVVRAGCSDLKTSDTVIELRGRRLGANDGSCVGHVIGIDG